jgi:hypothetical protein
MTGRGTPDPRIGTASALRSRSVRAMWVVAVMLLVIGLGAWGTTCTGPRPRPTGETIPAGDTSSTSTLAPDAPAPGG